MSMSCLYINIFKMLCAGKMLSNLFLDMDLENVWHPGEGVELSSEIGHGINISENVLCRENAGHFFLQKRT